jgi:hypothetical protein
MVWFGLVRYNGVYAPVEFVLNPSSIALISSSSMISVHIEISQYRHQFHLK